MNGEKLLVAVDWDEPLKPFKPGFFAFHNNKYGKDLSHEGITDFDMSSVMGYLSFDAYMDDVDEYHATELDDSTLAVREDAVEVMEDMSEYFDYAVITNRKSRFKPYTLKQMELALPRRVVEAYHLEDFMHLENGRKGKFAKQIGAVALVDDRPPNIESAIEHGVYGILFNDQQNAHYRGDVVRVDDWYQIRDELLARFINVA